MTSTRANVRALLLRMLAREDALRLADATQRKYAACGDEGAGKLLVTAAVQRRVVREFGLDAAEGLELLRSATALFPDDRGVVRAAHWLRHNICAPCPLRVGELVPDAPLFAADGGARTSARALAARDARPTVLAVGSHT